MVITPIRWDENKFEVGESYHLKCTNRGDWYLIAGEKKVIFSLSQLEELSVRFASHTQRLGSMSIMLEHIILNDVCRDVRSTNFVVVETFPQVVFAIKLMPLTPSAP